VDTLLFIIYNFWPLLFFLIPLITSVIYGLKTKRTGVNRLLFWFVINLIISFASGFASLYFMSHLCSSFFDSCRTREIISYTKEALDMSYGLIIIGIPLLYLGVFIKKKRNFWVKWNK